MICAAATAEDFTGTVVVVGVVEEETPCSRGAMMIHRAYEPPDVLIVGEPSGWSTVVVGYKGKLDLSYRVECPSTHPSNPVVKASEYAARCWQELTHLLGPAAGHAAFDQPGATLTSISGDLRSAEDDLVARLRERMPTGKISVINSVRACRVSRGNPAVTALSAGIRCQQARPAAKVKTATSDMNTLAEAWQIPMATYGPGDSRLDHSDEEHITIAEYFRGIAVLATALTELGSASHRFAAPRDSVLSGSMP
jgi:[amino group carrier protein]-lysine/ornithine hydrolase